MKFFITLVFFATSITSSAQDFYNIKVTLKPLKNQYIYLGHYYGKQLPIIDSVLLNDKSEGVFKGDKKLPDGVYFIKFSADQLYILLDKNYKFSVEADTADLSYINFTGSPESSTFSNYLGYRNKNYQKLNSLYQQNKPNINPTDSVKLVKEIETVQENLRQYRLNLIQEYPSGFLATMLKASQDIHVPEDHPGAAKDTLFAYKYIKAHYWDVSNFYDDRLIRTPFFESRLDVYFNQFVNRKADSVNKEIDWILSYANANEEMQKYMLMYFVNRYLRRNSAMDQQVFVHVFEKYFAQKNYTWLSDVIKKTITNRAYTIMATSPGKAAAAIELPDTAGIKTSLQNLPAAYTLIAIWDPTCGHCKELLPRLDSFYKAKWKPFDLKIFALAMETDGTKDKWGNLIKALHLTEWTHVYYSKAEDKERTASGKESYSQLYNVVTFPTLYLLDKDKKIIAKFVTPEQVDKILKLRSNK